MKKFGLYVHIPFCPYKCNYCDFLTFSSADKKIEQYMVYLNTEIEMYRYKGYKLDSIFIGGGTPSYIDYSFISSLMEKIKDVFILTDDCEISIEMNPNTLTKEKVQAYVEVGINRYSLGVQTFADEILKVLGRSHTKNIVLADIAMLREAGIKNLSLDMMLANPKQDMEILDRDLEIISKLDVDHISYYSLILEDRTLFKYWLEQGKIELFDQDLERDMFNKVKKKLFKYGYSRYEISNFAKSGMESRHNSKYWKQEPYLAVGLGATSNYDGNRRKNFSKFKDYFESIDRGDFPVESLEELSLEDREKEYIIMYMRLLEGFSIEDINAKYNIDFLEKYKLLLKKYKDLGIIEVSDGNCRFTDYGLDVSNMFYIDLL